MCGLGFVGSRVYACVRAYSFGWTRIQIRVLNGMLSVIIFFKLLIVGVRIFVRFHNGSLGFLTFIL